MRIYLKMAVVVACCCVSMAFAEGGAVPDQAVPAGGSGLVVSHIFDGAPSQDISRGAAAETGVQFRRFDIEPGSGARAQQNDAPLIVPNTARREPAAQLDTTFDMSPILLEQPIDVGQIQPVR